MIAQSPTQSEHVSLTHAHAHAHAHMNTDAHIHVNAHQKAEIEKPFQTHKTKRDRGRRVPTHENARMDVKKGTPT